MEAMSFRYNLSPIIANNFNWSIGEKLIQMIYGTETTL